MHDQGLITTERAARRRAPVAAAAQPRSSTPKKVSRSPYFTSWVEDQLVDRYGTREHLRRRPQDPHHARPRASRRRPSRRSPGGSAASARARRWSRSTTTPAACARWSAARTSSSGRSTSPRRDTASRDRRSSRSPWSRRSRRASRPGRTFVSAPKTLDGPRGDVQGRELRGPLRRRHLARRAPRPSSDNSVYAEVGYKLVGTRAIAQVAQGDGSPHPRLAQPRDGAGRAEAGRDAARDGEGLRDARRGRPGRVRLARAAYEGGPVTYTRVEGQRASTTRTRRAASA